MIKEADVKSGATRLFRFECHLCGGFKFEEAETIEELTEALNLGGWEDCIIGESEGIFCPDCIDMGQE
ncbi:MAG: hypothetical protein WC055_00165 [Melioribacteraceae bacterium]